MPSGSRSVGGTCDHGELAAGGAAAIGIAPVMSLTGSRRAARPAAEPRSARYPACSVRTNCSTASRPASARSSWAPPALRALRAWRGSPPAREPARRGAGSLDCSIIGSCGVAAGIEQRHRHLERAEHDHDHARADQQRADPGGDVRGRPCRPPWPCRRPCPWLRPSAERARLLGGGAAAAACAARRAAAMKLDEFTGSLRPGSDLADRVFGSRDPFRRRGQRARSAACPARADDPAAIPARLRRAALRQAAPGFR